MTSKRDYRLFELFVINLANMNRLEMTLNVLKVTESLDPRLGGLNWLTFDAFKN